MMVLAQFRQKYPQGSLISELVDIDRGTYIVKVSLKVNDLIFTALAGAEKVEIAEDKARDRAIATLFSDYSQTTLSPSIHPVNSINPVLPVNQPPDVTPKTILNTGNGNGNVEVNDSHTPPIASPSISPTENQIVEPAVVEQIKVDEPATVPDPPSPPPSNSETDITQNQTVATGNLFEGTYNPKLDLDSPENVSPEMASPIIESTATSEEIKMTDFKFMEIKQQTDLEIRRLGWTKEYGREFLMSHYGKRTRLHLTNDELLQFLQYLESQPTPS